jgi:hypothetical protein
MAGTFVQVFLAKSKMTESTPSAITASHPNEDTRAYAAGVYDRWVRIVRKVTDPAVAPRRLEPTWT